MNRRQELDELIDEYASDCANQEVARIALEETHHAYYQRKFDNICKYTQESLKKLNALLDELIGARDVS